MVILFVLVNTTPLLKWVLICKKKFMKKFLRYLIIWIAENLSIPFWVVGHVHLSLNVYNDIYEVIASFGMNIIVGVGFYFGWRESLKK